MLEQAHIAKSYEEGRSLIQEAISNGKGFEKQKQFFLAQGGDISYLEHTEKFPVAKFITPIVSEKEGYVSHIDSLDIGVSAMKLGAGRETLTDKIDMSSGIVLNKKVGDYVKVGEVLATAYTNKANVDDVYKDIHNAFAFAAEKVEVHPIIHEYIHK